MSALNPQLRFDALVVGAANRLAVTAARAVSESLGTVYNPLFIYSAPGLGKTHLLTAVGHAAVAERPELALEYVTFDDFSESFHAAIAAGEGEAWRRRWLGLDLLLLDDAQFLASRHEMQAELLRLVDAMVRANRQIILTSDRPPAEIDGLDERLVQRVSGGLVVDISSPDYETRVAILRRKAEERASSFAGGVLEALASAGSPSVRELLGMLHRLVALQAVSDEALTPARVRELFGAAAPAAGGLAAAPDEFADFLSELAHSLSEQVAPWRTAVGEALLRWEGEGLNVRRLQQLLDADVPTDPEQALAAFEADATRLLEIRAEVAELARDLANAQVLREPDELANAEALLQRARERNQPPPAPSPLWQLDDFLESAGNRMALHAARVVRAEPGEKFNPIVIVGASGTGKSHLLHAIGNALLDAGVPTVACLNAGDFVNELIAAIERDDVATWRARYRRAGALLLDDIHLLAGKTRTQDELFLLFNHFAEERRQMVFTSAVTPGSLGEVEPRLQTRLEGGLVAELPAPDRDLKGRFLERLLGASGDRADSDLVAYLADRPAESLRQVQALAQRVVAAAEAQEVRPDVAFARRTLEGPLPVPRSTRVAGLVLAMGGGIRSPEKAVWDWPEVGERLIEEWR